MSSIYGISRIGVHRDLNHWFIHEIFLLGVTGISLLFIGRVSDVDHFHGLRHHFSIPKRRRLQSVHTLSPRIVRYHFHPWLCHTLLTWEMCRSFHSPERVTKIHFLSKNTVSHITGRQQALHFSGKRPPPLSTLPPWKMHLLPSPRMVSFPVYCNTQVARLSCSLNMEVQPLSLGKDMLSEDGQFPDLEVHPGPSFVLSVDHLWLPLPLKLPTHCVRVVASRLLLSVPPRLYHIFCDGCTQVGERRKILKTQ